MYLSENDDINKLIKFKEEILISATNNVENLSKIFKIIRQVLNYL